MYVPGSCEYQKETLLSPPPKQQKPLAQLPSVGTSCALREAVTGIEGSIPPPGTHQAVLGVTTSVGELEQQLENQLKRAAPGPQDRGGGGD